MIVIPMVGNSSRFFKEGFTQPKYTLELWGRPILDWVLHSFVKYWKSEQFLFAARTDFGAVDYICQTVERLGISDFDIVSFDRVTRGQADTVHQALCRAKSVNESESVHIFNADSFYSEFELPDLKDSSGCLDVFYGEGEHWSFVSPVENSDVVAFTTEKRRVSNLCSSGFYSFSNVSLFEDAFRLGSDQTASDCGELYIAPMYNSLIETGKTIRYRIVDNSVLHFSGVPDEYRQLCAAKPVNWKES